MYVQYLYNYIYMCNLVYIYIYNLVIPSVCSMCILIKTHISVCTVCREPPCFPGDHNARAPREIPRPRRHGLHTASAEASRGE